MRKKKSKSKQKPKTLMKPLKKTPRGKRAVGKKKTQKPPTKKAAQKKMATRRSRTRRKSASVDTERDIRQELRTKNLGSAGRMSGRQTGDLEGLSRAEQADSESVDELVEEGNLFEAGAVAGVEEADNQDEREVHTHELPEDDVPEEYLEKE